jgi:hypothetical protein
VKKFSGIIISALLAAHAQNGLAENMVIDAYGESTMYGAWYDAASAMPAVLQSQLAQIQYEGYTYQVNNEGRSATTALQLLSGTDSCDSNTCTRGALPAHNPSGPFSGTYSPWKNQMAQSAARVVILNRGINEAYQAIPQATFTGWMNELINSAQKMGKLVVLQTPNWTAASYNSDVQSNANTLKSIAGQTLKYSDSYAISQPYGQQNTSTYPNTYYHDQLHPTPTLYALMVNTATTGLLDVTKAAISKLRDNTDITRLYIAIVNRAPDTDGLNYWSGLLRSGSDRTSTRISLIAAMLNSDEAKTIYAPSLDCGGFVTQFYQAVLGRAPDASGQTYWTGQCNNNLASNGNNLQLAKAKVADDMVNAVVAYSGTDSSALRSQKLFANKTAVGLYFSTVKVSNDVTKAKTAISYLNSRPDPTTADAVYYTNDYVSML